MQEDLAKMGVMIRHYNNKELKGYVRVSVGMPEHTDALMDGLSRLSQWISVIPRLFLKNKVEQEIDLPHILYC